MAHKKKENGDSIHEQLSQLHTEKRIPFDVREAQAPQRRWQKKSYASGVNYTRPEAPEDMGRYNDPTSQTGICYTADIVATAMAESYGRVYHRSPDEFFLGMSDLQKARIHTLETTRETKVVNMVKLQALLHLTADQVMGEDYSMTQRITDWFANTPGLDYDGIAYKSRHFGEGMCTAYWVREGTSDPLADVANAPADEYIDTMKENFPQNWEEKDITGFEIITETLNFKVRS